MAFPADDTAAGFAGRSPRVQQVRALLQRLSHRRSPVLIQGESGTGKEVAARTLFNLAPIGNFVPIDCASLVGTMMESELFGHVRGAFTGAVDSKRGLIELASGGTAFFDEIGELPIEMQVKLLRVLQEQELRPVGSLHRIRLDVRVVAATNRNLEKEVAAGRFREDLFHRLNVVRITLPPLRERKEDIPLLAEKFLASAPGQFVLSKEAMDALVAYDWPGNVRELRNCLERMMAFNSGPVLQVGDLPTPVANRQVAAAAQGLSFAAAAGAGAAAGHAHSVPAPHAFSRDTVLPLQELERRAIVHALQFTRGDRTAAAALLQIGRTTLYRKMKDFDIA